MEKTFEKSTFSRRLRTMLAVDARRMFGTPLFYILLGIAVAIPILILVMTTMMDGTVSVNPQTGEETVMEGFKNVWQIIGSVTASAEDGAAGTSPAMSMDLVSMCNIDLLYFGVAALICIFIADDFRSGYAKNLFAVRAKKGDYVTSKLLICTLGGALLVLGFCVGTLIGGGIAGLPFAMEGFHIGNLLCCLLSKMLLMGIFTAVYSLMAVIAKHKLWLSILLSLCIGMFLFNIAPMVAPLDAGPVQVLLALVASALLSLGLGFISRQVLRKIDIL